MELDIQRFMRNADQQQFEFQHFPTSYLRAAAHRVAQHYGLQTMVSDILLDGSGKILVRKTPECRFPAAILSDIPAKQSENDKTEQVKIVLRPRPSKSFQNNSGEFGGRQNLVRTVEERKEDYDRARARIFNNSSSPKSEGSPQLVTDGRNLCSYVDEGDYQRNSNEELEKSIAKEGACTVAIFRDREKDRIDPDYDRSYGRYLRNAGPNQSFNVNPYGAAVQPPFVQYDLGLHHLQQQMPTQPSVGFRVSDHALNSPNPYSSIGCNHNSRDAVYMHWPSPSMMYAHSYEQIRHAAAFQVPFCPPPLTFGNSRNR